jgi:hypothetical protein
MAKLIKAVFVRDPERHRTVLLNAGEEPEPRLAALVTNPDAWEDGKPPAEATESKADTASGKDGDGDTDDSADKEAAPAAKKTAARKTAATGRSRGRDAAGEGTSGE